MKKLAISFMVLLFAIISVSGMTVASAEAKKTITNDFINDWNYYSENFDDYLNANWRYCCGTIDEYYEMSYFAPQKMWVGTEAYCEISNGIPHPGTNEMIVVVWTAPCGGTLSFDFSARKKYHGVGDGTAAMVYNNDKEMLFEAIMQVGDAEAKEYSDNYSVNAGDNVYFVLDYVGNNWEDGTVFDIQISLTDFTAPVVVEKQEGCGGSIAGVTLAFPLAAISYLLIKKRKSL